MMGDPLVVTIVSLVQVQFLGKEKRNNQFHYVLPRLNIKVVLLPLKKHYGFEDYLQIWAYLSMIPQHYTVIIRVPLP